MAIEFLSQSPMNVVLYSLLREEVEVVAANLLAQDLLMILAAVAIECLGRRIHNSMRGAKAEIHFLAELEGAVVAYANDGDL